MKAIVRSLVFVFALTAYSHAQYSNATLNGPWYFYSMPLRPSVDSTMYLVFDGKGSVTAYSFFGMEFNLKYSVTTSGAFSVTDSGQAFFSGQLTSQNFGTISGNWAITRVLNPGALTDSLIGVLSFCSSTKNITLHIDSIGEIVSATGLTPPVSGRVYVDSGIFLGHIKTGDSTELSCYRDTGSFDEFTIYGMDKNDSLVGTIGLDGPNSTGNNRSGTVNLVRKGKVTNGVIFFLPTRLKTSAIGYNGVMVVYSLNGKQILKTSFTKSATKTGVLQINNKTLARGVYRYCFFSGAKIMEEGNFVVK